MKRRLIDEKTEVPELVNSETFSIKTKCPEKWLLIDLETGECYIPSSSGKLQWKKVDAKFRQESLNKLN